MSTRPQVTEYAPYYAGYVALVPEDNVLAVLATQAAPVSRIAAVVTGERETYRYEPGKWSVRELLGHLIDAERAFGYRIFAISRGEETPIPGFDEQQYVRLSRYHTCTAAELAAELASLRDANLRLMARLDDEAWTRRGTASGVPVTVRAVAYIMAGHVRHHLAILSERYEVVLPAE
jgi:hypothetical protein